MANESTGVDFLILSMRGDGNEKVVQEVVGALGQKLGGKFQPGSNPPVYELCTDWTYHQEWSDVTNPIQIPNNRFIGGNSFDNGHESIAGKIAEHNPKKILVVAPHFFSYLGDDISGAHLSDYKTSEHSRANVAEQLKAFAATAPDTQAVIYDPEIEKRKESMTGVQKTGLDKLIEIRVKEFAEVSGMKPANITVTAAVKDVPDLVASQGRKL